MSENQGNQLPPAIAANQNPAPHTMYDYAKPSLTGTESSIVRHTIAANNFELNPNTIQMIQQFVQFDGLQDKDPNTHLANFLEFCDTFKINGASDDAIRPRLFSFSLRNKAKQWLNSLPRGSITTWEQMTKKFLLKYFSPAKTTKLRNDISSFVQMDLETLYDAWRDTRIYYEAAGRTINNKTLEEAYEFIEEMTLNNYQWQVMRTKPTKTSGVYNVDSVTMLSNQVELLNKKIDGLLGFTQVHQVMRCDSSGGGVHTEYQSFNPTTEEEQVNYMGNNNIRSQNNPYSNTYNVGWRNHPNFSWGGQGNQKSQNLQDFQQPPYQQEKKPNLEELLSKFISVSETRFQNTETALKNQQASIQWLETQIGQLSKLISE
ncbi:hypothetical protein PVK06_048890 [Gossypium arboreum]|uniref:Retrotransposon gag domain-containing protein n=1 Tax=Gossypium arboreum TaxID=29729 RepID=A0ABR0MHA2_GOSAR|nr:hypothetical protein PVK06_048890 [Gossypium arboreum]